MKPTDDDRARARAWLKTYFDDEAANVPDMTASADVESLAALLAEVRADALALAAMTLRDRAESASSPGDAARFRYCAELVDEVRRIVAPQAGAATSPLPSESNAERNQ